MSGGCGSLEQGLRRSGFILRGNFQGRQFATGAASLHAPEARPALIQTSGDLGRAADVQRQLKL